MADAFQPTSQEALELSAMELSEQYIRGDSGDRSVEISPDGVISKSSLIEEAAAVRPTYLLDVADVIDLVAISAERHNG